MRRLAIVILLALPPGAQAAPPWSEPRTFAPRSAWAGAPSIAFTADGRGLVGWNTLAGSATPATERAGQLLPLTATGEAGAQRTLGDSLEAPPVLFGAGRTLLLRSRLATVESQRYRLRATFGTLADPLRRTQTLGRPRLPSPARLAANRRGLAVAAWVDFRRDHRYRLRVAVRRPGGRFGRPRTLLAGRTPSTEVPAAQVAVAVGPRGRAVVAMIARRASRRAVLAFVREAGGRFRGALRAGTHEDWGQIQAAVTRAGRAIVAWGSQDGGIEANRPWTVRAATLPPNRRSFRPSQTIDRGTMLERPEGVLSLAAAANRATLTWTSMRDRLPVMVATSDRTGRFGAPAVVAPSGIAQELAVRAGGEAVLTWLEGDRFAERRRLMAAQRAPGAETFGPAEEIAEESDPTAVAAAIDPRTGRPAVAWTAVPPQAPATLRVATRGY